MDLNRTQVAVGLALLVVAGGALAVVGGVFPGGGNGDAADVPTATGTPYSASGNGSGGAEPPFQMAIESIESCGQTCRDVTATLVNNQDRQATGVTVYTQIHAGESTDGDVVWEGTQDVGTLAAGGSETDTKRVDLGYMDAAKVQQHDGKVTILLTVETDRRTVSFVQHRDVT